MQGGGDYKVEKTPHGPAVGFIPGASQIGYEFDLQPGDRIFLYTDGLNEAKNPKGERYGIERMLKVLNENKELSNEMMVEKMGDEVHIFAGEEPQFDDMTMLSFTYNG
jgi:serine phosphatase RsbU (regulator of sigma subunit)